MQRRLLPLALVLATLAPAFTLAQARSPASLPMERPFRPPAVPLVAVDPYFSIWSFADHLTYDSTRHWTGARMTVQSLVRVDGTSYRIMGDEPRNVQPARQVSLRVFPTQTIYKFEAGGVGITLTFLTPDLPHDLDVLSRPVTYLTWTARSLDGKQHDVSIYYDNTGELVVNTPDEAVTWSAPKISGLSVLKMGTVAQPVLGKAGDSVRINWGYLYAAAPESERAAIQTGAQRTLIRAFVSEGGGLPAGVAGGVMQMPRAANDHWPTMAFDFNLGSVSATPVSRHLILAYDEITPIEYFHQQLRPWWQHAGATIDDLLQSAERDYPQLALRSQAFDQKLMADLTQAGGPEYAKVAALAYRQSFAANKLAIGPHGQPLMFLKEISSCGCAQTADVIYPESPILLLLNPKLLEDSLVPLIDYAQSGDWPYPYAPHDLGTYPIDNARVPSKMESMPVEETSNMLLMIAGIAKAEGSASFAAKYWPLLTKWANYLKENGLDPGDQLCTDDFTGLLAHNANLSLKAVEALGGYAMLARMLGKKQEAEAYGAVARQYARKWMKLANDGDHTRLAYDRPGTWSQKYNLIWDQVLGIHLFPENLAREEVAYYKNHATRFGYPLDSRSAFTKLDWESWTAALAGPEFRSLFSGVYNFADKTPTRVPLSDWYWTVDGTQTGFQARPVVGGVYMKMLTNPVLWKKWAGMTQ
ncbi:MAG: glutaminase domain-containing protein [Terriglobia bacterium]